MASTPSATTDAFLAQLYELLRIESVSSDGAHPDQLRAAAAWIADLIGGDATVTAEHGNPLVDGLIPASRAGAPTVIAYGHYDVQAPGPRDLWDSDPFEPEVRDGWIHGRGVTDDKGNFFAVLRAALDLAAAGELGVNVRVLADGEEEIGGHSVIHHLATVEGDFGAAVIFDGGMVDGQRPAITTGLRGLAGAQLRLRTGRRELHSGMYGGAAANAVHDLHRVLARVIDLPEAFSAGIAPVTDSERSAWTQLPDGDALLREAGAIPADPAAGSEFYERTGARPSLTVHSVGAGDPDLHKTSIQQEARASVSLRLAPGQDAEAMSALFERTLREACPARRDARRRDVAAGAARMDGPRAAGPAARLRRDRAGDGCAPARGALRRHDPGRGGLRGARDPDDPVRVRHGRRQHPLAQRADGAAPARLGVRVGPRDLPRSARDRLNPVRLLTVGALLRPPFSIRLRPQCGRQQGE